MKTRALIVPALSLLIVLACRTPTGSAPTPMPRGLTVEENTLAPKSEYVYILVERDPSSGELTVSPDPAVVYGNQKVEWIALDPNLRIIVEWKNVNLDRPCPAPARRCGRRAFPVKVRTEARYAVRAFDAAGAEVAFIDPVLDILPVFDPGP